MKSIYLFLLVILSPSLALCCGNEYEEHHHKLDGKEVEYSETNYWSFSLGKRFDLDELNKKKKALESKLKKDPKNYKLYSDLGLTMLKLGQIKEAVAILRGLVKKYPKEYNINANLGTAYELAGKLDSSNYFLRKALRINPDSHDGSEWIHLKIIEAKIKLLSQPDYLKTHSIIGLEIPDIQLFYQNYDGQKQSYKDSLLTLAQHLKWQLEERTKFVSPPDPVVANLLYDFANLVAVIKSVEEAIPIYEMALDYKPANASTVKNTYEMLYPLRNEYIGMSPEEKILLFCQRILIGYFLLSFAIIIVFLATNKIK